MSRDPDAYDAIDRPVIGVGNEYPPSTELALHTHRRGQLLHASTGAVAVTTPQGAWVTPSERAVWIPRGVPHAVKMIGAVNTRSVMIAEPASDTLGPHCKVIEVSSMLHELLREAAKLPVEYDEAGRDGLVMKLIIADIAAASVVPLSVPFPAHARLAKLCHAFLEKPHIASTIDSWAIPLGLNRRTFTRLFRRETGMSFAEWRQQACLAVALPMLAGGASVTSVAIDLGYDSPASFSAMFRRALGAPPSQYR